MKWRPADQGFSELKVSYYLPIFWSHYNKDLVCCRFSYRGIKNPFFNLQNTNFSTLRFFIFVLHFYHIKYLIKLKLKSVIIGRGSVRNNLLRLNYYITFQVRFGFSYAVKLAVLFRQLSVSLLFSLLYFYCPPSRDLTTLS